MTALAPELVLLHGLGSSRHLFDPILHDLQRTHAVTPLDLPGFGNEPVDERLRPGIQGYADWVSDQCEERGIRSPHVVGSSMGAAIALELGRRGTASRVTAFAPIGCWTPIGRAWCQAVVGALRVGARLGGASLVAALHTKVGRIVLLSVLFGRPTRVAPQAAQADLVALAEAPGFASASRSFTGQHAVQANPRVATVIVWGRRDAVLPAHWQARRARRLYPHARHILLGAAGHLPFSDQPTTCTRLITQTHPFTTQES